MKFYSPLFLFLWLFGACSACRMPEAPREQSFTVMTWNVQNLFDHESSGLEYDEFNPALSPWTESLYRLRLENLSRVIRSVGREGPDLLLLQEVENQAVLDRLDRDYLDGAYPYRGAWVYTDSAVRCGYLSRRPPSSVHLHFPGRYGTRPLRPILELRFDLDGEELVVLNNHWKSRSGGAAATEGGRILSARSAAARIKALRRQGRDLVLLAGDLNGSREDYRPGGAQTAQIPLAHLPGLPWADSLYVTQNREEAVEVPDRAVLFSPWGEIAAPGSYFFQNRWMKLDHFLLTPGFWDGAGWEYARAECLDGAPPAAPGGRPDPWATWRESGYSDHLPLLLFLKKTD